jgi:LacI family transcriptional regulator
MSAHNRTERKPRRVALLLDPLAYRHVQMIEGVRLYTAENNCNWSVRVIEPSHLEQALGTAMRWGCDGLIASYTLQPLKGGDVCGVPAVAISPPRWDAATAWVTDDERAIGLRAAEVLTAHPLASGGCIVFSPHPGSRQRAEAFEEAFRAAGIPCERFEQRCVVGSAADTYDHLSREGQPLMDWLVNLPKPTGIFAWHDVLGVYVLDLCHSAGLACPGDVLVCSVDNLEPLCRASSPSLSSIETPLVQTGREAARIVDELMLGAAPPNGPRVIEPGPVHERGSTAWVGTGDPLVQEALTLIGRGWLNHRGVTELSRELQCSRSTLERRFRSQLGKSVLDALQEHRVRFAKDRLREGLYSVAAIARECGFTNPMSLETLMKRHTGKLPREVRGKGRA